MRLCDGFQSQGFDGSKVSSDRVLPLRISPRVRCAARDLAGRAQFKPVEKGVQDGPGMNGRAARFSAAQAVQV